MKQYNSILRELWLEGDEYTDHNSQREHNGFRVFFSRMVQVVGVNVAKPLQRVGDGATKAAIFGLKLMVQW